MNVRTMVFALLLFGPAISQAQVFKCVDGQGRITFSQTPCAGQASESVDVKIDKSRPPAPQSAAQMEIDKQFKEIRESIRSASQSRPAAVRQVERTYCKTFSDTELRTMIVKRQVVPGMKVSDALRAWGKPERINGDQYVYHWPEASAYFYSWTDGCVRNVQGTFRGK